MIFPVLAALRAVAKALWRVGDCEARVVASSAKAALAAAAGHFPKEFGAPKAFGAPLHRKARKPIWATGPEESTLIPRPRFLRVDSVADSGPDPCQPAGVLGTIPSTGGYQSIADACNGTGG